MLLSGPSPGFGSRFLVHPHGAGYDLADSWERREARHDGVQTTSSSITAMLAKPDLHPVSVYGPRKPSREGFLAKVCGVAKEPLPPAYCS